MATKKKITKTTKRWVSDSEIKNIRKHHSSLASYLSKLIENDNINSDSKKLLRAAQKDVISAVNKIGVLSMQRQAWSKK